MIFHRTANVPAFDNYRRYLDDYLRPDFQYRCAYCLTHEYYFAGKEGGEIDHFRPLNPPAALGKDFSHLKNEYSNLYWSCPGCNRAKSNTWPTDGQYNAGFRFLDPCEQDHDDHWAIYSDGTIGPITNIGRYTVSQIRLDRPLLNERRASFIALQSKLKDLTDQLATVDLSEEVRNWLTERLVDVERQLFPPFL